MTNIIEKMYIYLENLWANQEHTSHLSNSALKYIGYNMTHNHIALLQKCEHGRGRGHIIIRNANHWFIRLEKMYEFSKNYPHQFTFSWLILFLSKTISLWNCERSKNENRNFSIGTLFTLSKMLFHQNICFGPYGLWLKFYTILEEN